MLTLQCPLIKLQFYIPKDALDFGMGTGMGTTLLLIHSLCLAGREEVAYADSTVARDRSTVQGP